LLRSILSTHVLTCVLACSSPIHRSP